MSSARSSSRWPVCTHSAVAAQLVAVVEAFLLCQREAFPPHVEVTQPRVDLAIVYPAWKTRKKMMLGGIVVDLQVALHWFSPAVLSLRSYFWWLLLVHLNLEAGYCKHFILNKPFRYGNAVSAPEGDFQARALFLNRSKVSRHLFLAPNLGQVPCGRTHRHRTSSPLVPCNVLSPQWNSTAHKYARLRPPEPPARPVSPAPGLLEPLRGLLHGVECVIRS